MRSSARAARRLRTKPRARQTGGHRVEPLREQPAVGAITRSCMVRSDRGDVVEDERAADQCRRAVERAAPVDAGSPSRHATSASPAARRGAVPFATVAGPPSMPTCPTQAPRWRSGARRSCRCAALPGGQIRATRQAHAPTLDRWRRDRVHGEFGAAGAPVASKKRPETLAPARSSRRRGTIRPPGTATEGSAACCCLRSPGSSDPSAPPRDRSDARARASLRAGSRPSPRRRRSGRCRRSSRARSPDLLLCCR